MRPWEAWAPKLPLEDDVESVDDAGDVAENGQADVDQEVGAAPALEEDTERREDDGEDDLADIAGGERHDGRFVCLFVGWLVLSIRCCRFLIKLCFG